MFLSRCIVAASIWLAATQVLPAQVATGRIEGVVTDSSGAVVPGARVTVRDIRRDTAYVQNANAEGFFVFPSLQPSVYQLTVEAQGFAKAVVEGIELNVSSTVSQQIKLEVGAVSEQVVVSAEAVRVNVSDAQIGRNITMKDIDTLPQLARNPMVLAVYQPGVSIDPGDNSFSRVNGTRQGSNNAKLDGIDVNDAVVPRLGLSLTAVNVDSVEEFRVITNGAKAEYGRNAGGQIEMITRSGTNQFHGGAFEFMRNTKLNANTFFNNSSGVARPKFIQNTFGANFGGPIRKDKTFIYGVYQGQRTAQEVVRNRTVLTPEAKQGLFRYRPAGGDVQTINLLQLDPLRRGIDPFVKTNALDLLPNPNNFDLGDGLNTAGFRFNNPAGSYNDQFTIRGDHQLTSTHRIFYRHSWFRTYSIDALNNADAIFPGQPHGSQGGIRWGYAIGSDWTITPSWINEFRLGHQSASVDFRRPARPRGPGLDATTWTDPINLAFPQGRNSPVYDFTDNVTKLKGKHTIKGGYTFRRIHQYGYNDAGIFPNIITDRSNGNAPNIPNPPGISSADLQRYQELYNDLLGRVAQVSTTFYSDLTKFQPAGTGRVRNFLFWDHAFFIQDDWKVNRKLTLNLGLRWEMFGPPVEQAGYQGTVDAQARLNTVNNINDMSVIKQSRFYNRDWTDFAPRFGFAWDPTGSGKTAIRGSAGIFYDRLIGATTSSVDGATPGFAQTVVLFPNAAAGSDVRIATLPGLPQAPAAPVLRPPSNRQVTIGVFDQGLRSPYSLQFNFTIQREIVRNTVIDLGWVRTRGKGLFNWMDVNQPRVFGDFLSAFLELQRFSANSNALPSPNNTLVRIYGSPQAAVAGVGGATILAQGLLGTAADNVDRTTGFPRYAAAGVSDFYLRNFPQWNQVWVGTNVGRSWYDSFQLSVRRTAGSLRLQANYTWSKNLDVISVDGNGFTNIIDNYNFNQFRGRADVDRPHSFNGSAIYVLPIGQGKFIGRNMPSWANRIVGGWEIGSLMVWQSGSVLTVSSARRTGPANVATWANYTGNRNIGSVDRRGDGVYYWSPGTIERFSFPGAGEFGTAGRNTFRGPRFFNTDISIVKRFGMPWSESHRVTYRAEMYNMFNNPNFGGLGTSLLNPPTFGKLSATVGNARIMQMALRYDF
ncbi:MAG: TonB-dependent receptor [Bryobacteraceae bacterium]|nr:TonB-dependent receptor [Bryobacteraceae bacterium]MDW8378344.1 TonB-dependent receptor [Bryobacterales bacterium]